MNKSEAIAKNLNPVVMRPLAWMVAEDMGRKFSEPTDVENGKMLTCICGYVIIFRKTIAGWYARLQSKTGSYE
ncbi:MAG: hypothetical protein RR387_05150 [Clostridiales bacterium]